jgi:hypothetical protein
MTFEERLAQLAPLETFDPKAFRGDSSVPQELCDFVLALALVYNDFRDVVVAQGLLNAALPNDTSTPTPRLGELGGIHAHLNRLMAALVHELAKLIERSDHLLSHPFFESLVKKLPRAAREAWSSVVDATKKNTATDSLSRLVLFARHKVAFHYDAEEIGRGYRRAFIDDPSRVPFVSRGDNMAKSRFYFADAAADTYLRTSADKQVVEEFFSAKLDLFDEINHALRELVSRFVNERRFAYRPPNSA